MFLNDNRVIKFIKPKEIYLHLQVVSIYSPLTFTSLMYCLQSHYLIVKKKRKKSFASV